jgi:hypothetical protein
MQNHFFKQADLRVCEFGTVPRRYQTLTAADIGTSNDRRNRQ